MKKKQTKLQYETKFSKSNRLGLKNTLTASLQWIKPSSSECSGYYTKQSDGEAPGLEYFFFAIIPRSTLIWIG